MYIEKIKSQLVPLAIFGLIFSAFKWGWPIWILTIFFPQEITGTLLDWFISWQSDSDALVTARLSQNYATGAFSFYGLLGAEGSYLSQFGLASNVLTLVPYFLSLSFERGLILISLLVITINSIFWSMLGYFLYKKFGWMSLIFYLVGLFQPWSLVANKSTYWFISLKLYPLIFLYFMYKNRIGKRNRQFAGIMYGFSLVVSILSGYEFITITLAVILAVFIYSQLEERVLKRIQFLNFIKLLGTSICLGTLGLLLHFFQLALFLGDSRAATSYLLSRLNGRILGDHDSEVPGFAASADISPRFILSKYLEMPILASPSNLPIFRYLTIFIFICLFLLVFNIFQARKHFDKRLERNIEIRNISVFIFLTLLGPLTWYLLAAPHSYIHFHINFILWYLPFIPLACGLLPVLYGRSFWILTGLRD